MKKLSVLVAVVISVGLSACAVTSAQRATAVKVVGTGLDIVQKGVDLATQLVVAKATGSADLTNKGNLLSSAASGLRSIEGLTNGAVTPALVGTTVRSFTNPDVGHWDAYADGLVALFTKEVAAGATTDQALEKLAVSADTTVATKVAATPAS